MPAFGVNESVELVLDLLAATRLVPADKLALARGGAQQTGSLARALVEEGIASSDGIARMLAARYELPLVDLAVVGVDAEAAKLLPLHVLERVAAIPYALDGDVLRVAVADPSNLHGIDELRLATRHPVELAVASRDDILLEIRRLVRASEAFGARAALRRATRRRARASRRRRPRPTSRPTTASPTRRSCGSSTRCIFQAAEDGASDVHFEPQEDALVVRFRIDGVLQEVQRIPKRLTAGVTTRLKVLAKLDIAERRKPQDGRISLNAAAAGRMLDVRVATLPTVEGESVVMRLLDKSKRPPTLQELGLSEEMRERLTDDRHAADRAPCSSPARPAPASRRPCSPR